MADIFDDARVSKLLAEAESAYNLYQDKSRSDRKELKIALDSMYKDLGK